MNQSFLALIAVALRRVWQAVLVRLYRGRNSDPLDRMSRTAWGRLVGLLLLISASCARAYPYLPPEYQYLFNNATVVEPVVRWSTCGKASYIPCTESDDPLKAMDVVVKATYTYIYCGMTTSGIGFVGYPMNGFQGLSWTDTGNIAYGAPNWQCSESATSWSDNVAVVWYCPSATLGYRLVAWHEDSAGNVAGADNRAMLRVVCVKTDPKIPRCVNECKGPPSYIAGDGVSMMEFVLTRREQDIPAAGPDGLEFARTFRSDQGWNHNYSSRLNKNGGGATPTGCLTAPYDSVVGGSPGSAVGCFAYAVKSSPSFKYVDSLGQSFDFSDNGSGFVSTAGVNHSLLPPSQSGLQQILLSSNEVEQFDASGNLVARRSASGGVVSLAYSDSATPTDVAPRAGLLVSAKDNYGRSISFRYGASGALAHAADSAGQNYDYDTESVSRFLSVAGPAGYAKTYKYNEPNMTSGTSQPDSLTGILDENATRYVSFAYDSARRVLYTERAGGVDHFQFAYPYQVTTPWGETLKYLSTTFDTLMVPWQVTRCRVGATSCPEAVRQFALDSKGNWTQATDFLGMATCRAVGSRNLETVRLEGLANTAPNCPADLVAYVVPVQQPGAVAAVRKISTQWHPFWRLRTREARPKLITWWVYNGQTDPSGNVVNCAPVEATVVDGVPIAVLCKRIEQATTDETGTLGFSAPLSGSARVWSYTYNASGQVLTEIEPQNAVTGLATRYTYYADSTPDHTRGDLQEVQNALGQVTRYTKYNAHGQLMQMVDANNVTTDYTYDARQRLQSVSVGGQTTNYEYWPTGLPKKVTLPDSSWVSYDYDDAHRLQGVSDNLGNSINYRLNNAGNPEEEKVKDPSGALRRQVGRMFDLLGRLQQVTGRE